MVSGKEQLKIPDLTMNQIEETGETMIYVKIDYPSISIPENEGNYDLERYALDLGIDEKRIKYLMEDEIVLKVDREYLNEIKKNSKIVSIEEMVYRTAFLQNSVPLINATLSHSISLNGINLTGLGNSICILDTGINYSHPDFGSCSPAQFLSGTCSKVPAGYDFINEDTNPMDDNGHGTHVAGIAAANGNIIGVAPDAKLIAIKVCSSTRSCPDADIIQGINWCITNKENYNISSISMSLGADCDSLPEYCSSGYCNSDPLAASINNAVSNGLAVIISSGNDGKTNLVSGPACVESAIPVGASNGDSIASFSNRWDNKSLIQIMAPGTSINSTNLSNFYSISSGTSMSAPHVSGAVSILMQYLNLSGKTKTVSQIKQTINNSGYSLNDLSSGRYFPRIDIFESIISYDQESPRVTLLSPNDGIYGFSESYILSCNSSDIYLSNVSLYVWNSSEIFNLTYLTNINSGENLSQFNVTLEEGDYEWNCLYTDRNSNSAFATSNRTLFVSDMNIELNYPENLKKTNQNLSFGCNVSSNRQLVNVSFFLWNSTQDIVFNDMQNISGNSNSSIFNYNFSTQQDYEWNCLYTDITNSSSYATSNRTVSYDITKPSIQIISPRNGSWYNAGRFNVSLDETGFCQATLDLGVNNFSMNSEDNISFSLVNSTLTEGQFAITYNCNDSAGNYNNTEISYFNIDLTSPQVTLLSPNDGDSASGTTQYIFSYNISDNLNISQCAVLLNGQSVKTNQSEILLNQTNNITYSVSPGSYSFQINCTDIAGNIGNSSSRGLSVSNPDNPDGNGGSGGGGGGGASSIFFSQAETDKGITKTLSKGDTVKIVLGKYSKSNHSIILSNFNQSGVKIILRSTPRDIYLRLGEELKIGLTNEKFYDIYLKIENITKTKVNLTIKTLWEEKNSSNGQNILIEREIENEPRNNFENQNSNNLSKSSRWMIFLFVLAGISVPIIIWIILKKRAGNTDIMRRIKWETR